MRTCETDYTDDEKQYHDNTEYQHIPRGMPYGEKINLLPGGIFFEPRNAF
jgi:hypothetical protein